jgi:DNA invertase Pin-like site-specific DNA recombinase
MVAEEERRMISKRTKDALAAAKRRGTKLGGDRGVIPTSKARTLASESIQAREDSRASDIALIIEDLQAAG